MNTSKTEIKYLILCAFLIVIAFCLNNFQILDSSNYGLQEMLRTMIYLCIFIFWFFSLEKRLVKRALLRYLKNIAALMIFWLFIRSVKYFCAFELITAKRFLWYLYYIPMIFIPLMNFYASLCISKPEEYTLPKCALLLLFPAILLFLSVITNDFHFWVFSFPKGMPMSDANYSYGVVYYIILIFSSLVVLASLVVVFLKCSITKIKKFISLPISILILGIIYSIIYITNLKPILTYFDDVTVVLCLMEMFLWETLIQCGLVPSNTNYIELFKASTIAAKTIDDNGKIVYESTIPFNLPMEEISQIDSGVIETNSDKRIRVRKINGGKVVWVEDVSEVNKKLERLIEIRERMSETNEILQAELKLKKHEAQIEVETKLYDKIDKELAPQFDELDRLLKKVQKEKDSSALLGEICTLGAYIKRRSNLILLSESNQTLPINELEYSVRETMENMKLNLNNVSCLLEVTSNSYVAAKKLLMAYDLFAAIIKENYKLIEAIIFRIWETNEKIVIYSEISTTKTAYSSYETYMKYFKDELSLNWEDSTLYMKLKVKKEEAK